MNRPLFINCLRKERHTVIQEAGILIEELTGGLPCIRVVREQSINVFIVLFIVIEEVGQKSR